MRVHQCILSMRVHKRTRNSWDKRSRCLGSFSLKRSRRCLGCLSVKRRSRYLGSLCLKRSSWDFRSLCDSIRLVSLSVSSLISFLIDWR